MRPRTAGKHGRLISLLIGALALLACLWLGRYAARQALLSYLFAFAFSPDCPSAVWRWPWCRP